MTQPCLPADDLPPVLLSQADESLRRQLELSAAKHFYERCSGVIQSLLCTCEWFITTDANALTLVIECPSQATNWRVLHSIVPIGKYLEHFTRSARIRVCPPTNLGTPFEIRVDEISIYRDVL